MSVGHPLIHGVALVMIALALGVTISAGPIVWAMLIMIGVPVALFGLLRSGAHSAAQSDAAPHFRSPNKRIG